MSRTSCPRVPLCAYADPTVRALRQHIPSALKHWDEDAIHDARVATRRLKAAMDLIAPAAPKKALRPLRKTLRRLRRTLGPLRDLDVMIGHLGEFSAEGKHAAAVAWVRDRLTARREKERRRTRRREDARDWVERLGAWDDLRKDVVTLADDVSGLMLASLAEQWAAFARQADGLANHLLDDEENHAAAAQDPHALRIAGKQLRYTFEMLAAEGHKLPADVGRTFKRMQSELGAWHDFVVLSERAMAESLRRQLAHHDPDLQADVLSLARATLRQSKRHLRRSAQLWRRCGPALEAVVGRLTAEEPSAPVAAAAPQLSTEEETTPGATAVTSTPAAAPPPDASSAA